MRSRRRYCHAWAGSMPVEQLSKKAMLTLPVGANETRWLFLRPCRRMAACTAGGRWPSGPGLQIRSWRIGGKHAAFSRQPGRRQIGLVADAASDPRGEHARGRRAIVQPQHQQRIPKPGQSHADTALGLGLGRLFRQRPAGQVQHVVQQAHLYPHASSQLAEIEAGRSVRAERIAHEARHIDRRARSSHGAAGVARRKGWWPTGVRRRAADSAH